MPSKQRVLEDIDKIDKPNVSINMLKHFVNSVTISIPTYLKKGDVILMFTGFKNRPCVVVKADSKVVYAIPLSTTEDEINLCESRSRFYGTSFFSRSIICAKTDCALNGFIGVYDNHKLLNKAIKLLKQEINTI